MPEKLAACCNGVLMCFITLSGRALGSPEYFAHSASLALNGAAATLLGCACLETYVLARRACGNTISAA